MSKFDLRLQDCVAGMGKLPDDSVDLVVTSPPYNLGIRYGKFRDKDNRQSYLSWCRLWAKEIKRLLKTDGSFFLNVGSAPSNPMLPHQIASDFSKIFFLQNTIHWIKSISIDQTMDPPRLHPLPQGEENARAARIAKRPNRAKKRITTYGHFKPISSKRFLNDCHEYIFHFTKSGHVALDRRAIGVPYQDKSNIARWSHTAGSDLRCRGNTWFIPYETIQNREKERPHPATFPVQLAEWCIKLHGIFRVQAMLDPFLGIGNSAVAAKNCAVKKFTGFEIDETYLAEANRRLEL